MTRAAEEARGLDVGRAVVSRCAIRAAYAATQSRVHGGGGVARATGSAPTPLFSAPSTRSCSVGCRCNPLSGAARIPLVSPAAGGKTGWLCPCASALLSAKILARRHASDPGHADADRLTGSHRALSARSANSESSGCGQDFCSSPWSRASVNIVFRLPLYLRISAVIEGVR